MVWVLGFNYRSGGGPSRERSGLLQTVHPITCTRLKCFKPSARPVDACYVGVHVESPESPEPKPT